MMTPPPHPSSLPLHLLPSKKKRNKKTGRFPFFLSTFPLLFFVAGLSRLRSATTLLPPLLRLLVFNHSFFVPLRVFLALLDVCNPLILFISHAASFLPLLPPLLQHLPPSVTSQLAVTHGSLSSLAPDWLLLFHPFIKPNHNPPIGSALRRLLVFTFLMSPCRHPSGGRRCDVWLNYRRSVSYCRLMKFQTQ